MDEQESVSAPSQTFIYTRASKPRLQSQELGSLWTMFRTVWQTSRGSGL